MRKLAQAPGFPQTDTRIRISANGQKHQDIRKGVPELRFPQTAAKHLCNKSFLRLSLNGQSHEIYDLRFLDESVSLGLMPHVSVFCFWELAEMLNK